MRPKTKWHKIDIYGCYFILNVSDNVDEERAKATWCKLLGEFKPNGSAAAMTSWNGRLFAIFMGHGQNISHGAIAHEVFHVTHRIHDRIGSNFSNQCHEPFTYLCQMLTGMVYSDLKKWNIKVSIP